MCRGFSSVYGSKASGWIPSEHTHMLAYMCAHTQSYSRSVTKMCSSILFLWPATHETMGGLRIPRADNLQSGRARDSWPLFFPLSLWSFLIFVFLAFNYPLLCIYMVCVHGYAHMTACVEGRGQLYGVSSLLLLPCGFQGLNSCH